MILHSQAYYTYGITFITDAEFDRRARELVRLQAEYPDVACHVQYHEHFLDWDGSTGMHLTGIDENRFLNKIYRMILYIQEHEPMEVTTEMAAFVDDIQRGILK